MWWEYFLAGVIVGQLVAAGLYLIVNRSEFEE